MPRRRPKRSQPSGQPAAADVKATHDEGTVPPPPPPQRQRRQQLEPAVAATHESASDDDEEPPPLHDESLHESGLTMLAVEAEQVAPLL
jgi:hypothetical protein